MSPSRDFKREAGRVELVYQINEGKPFHVGRIIIKGNGQSMDKLALREMRIEPGQLYDSSELLAAVDRIKSTPYFRSATITPIGDDPNYRDVLVEVQENQFRSFNVGAGVSSNGGGGNGDRCKFRQRLDDDRVGQERGDEDAIALGVEPDVSRRSKTCHDGFESPSGTTAEDSPGFPARDE